MTEISRRQFAVYLVAVVLVVLLGGRALRADEGAGAIGAVPEGGLSARPPDVAGAPDGAGAATGASGAGQLGAAELSTADELVLVHVAGAVRRPGVYELAAGARVGDALGKAGGGRSGADLDSLNLAAKVTDGQQVLVARRGRGTATAAGVAGAVAAGAGGPGAVPAAGSVGAPGAGAGAGAGAGSSTGGGPTVNVNAADVTQLEALNGVGPAIAAKIVEYRTQNGPFASVDDLAQVAGIGPKKLEAMRAQVAT